MADSEQIRNESRLTSLEVKQQRILENQEAMAKDIAEIKLTFAKVGGVIIGFTMIGAGIGWLLNTIKQSVGFMGN